VPCYDGSMGWSAESRRFRVTHRKGMRLATARLVDAGILSVEMDPRRVRTEDIARSVGTLAAVVNKTAKALQIHPDRRGKVSPEEATRLLAQIAFRRGEMKIAGKYLAPQSGTGLNKGRPSSDRETEETRDDDREPRRK